MGSRGADREMNLDYRLTPTKCGFGASPVLEKTSGKNIGAAGWLPSLHVM